jgi:hypothetical protein
MPPFFERERLSYTDGSDESQNHRSNSGRCANPTSGGGAVHPIRLPSSAPLLRAGAPSLVTPQTANDDSSGLPIIRSAKESELPTELPKYRVAGRRLLRKRRSLGLETSGRLAGTKSWPPNRSTWGFALVRIGRKTVPPNHRSRRSRTPTKNPRSLSRGDPDLPLR